MVQPLDEVPLVGSQPSFFQSTAFKVILIVCLVIATIVAVGVAVPLALRKTVSQTTIITTITTQGMTTTTTAISKYILQNTFDLNIKLFFLLPFY